MALQAQPGGTTVTPRDAPPDPYRPLDPSPSPTEPTAPSAGQDPIVAPSAPASSVTTEPAYTPDYTGSLQNDSGYQAAQSAAAQAQQTAEAQRQAAIRAALVQYGGDLPAGFRDAYGDVDQATLDAAKGNQFSTLANLHRNYEQSVEQFRKALAARGMVGSGDMNYGQQQMDQGYGQSQYDAGNQFGNAFQGALNQYAGVLGQNEQNLVSAIGAAEANQYSNPMNRPTAAKTANYNSELSSQYGVHIYTDDAGNTYDESGNPWSPPPPPPPAAPSPSYNYPSGDTESSPYSWGWGGKQ